MSLLFPIESTHVPTIVFMGGMNGTDYMHGVLERVAQNEWREISTQTSSGFRLTSQVETPERILLKDDSRNMPLELDLAARKARQR
jgi:hypothetical protein